MEDADHAAPSEAEFRVEFSVHLRYAKGTTVFQREERLPFVPFVGLDVLDDVLGEFKLEHVAWHSGSRMFLCQSALDRHYWTIQQAQRSMRKAGWAEEKEARYPLERSSHEESLQI